MNRAAPASAKPLLLSVLIAGGVAVALTVAAHFSHLPLIAMSTGVRWLAIALLGAYAFARRSLALCIFAGLLAGAECGYDFPSPAVHFQVLGAIFLRLIKVIIAPLLFATLVTGIAGHANLKKVGRMGLKALIYFEVVSTVALFLGFAAIRISRAGVGLSVSSSGSGSASGLVARSAAELILEVFPENIAKSVSENQVLQVVVFSVLFGVALALVNEARRKPMVGFCESLVQVMFQFTNLVMFAAPLGVFGAVAYTVGHSGLGVMLPLLKLLLTMYASLAVFVLGALWPIAIYSKLPLRRFLEAVAEPVTIAFATASSEAALPRALEKMESFGVPRDTAAFVLPTGYSFNLDGSSLYQSMALIFIAQAAGVPLTLGQQMIMMLTLLLTSKGTAGVARASLVVVAAAAASFHLPPEPLFLLFGIDQFMDMGRTALNVLGNCLATAVVARWEGELPRA